MKHRFMLPLLLLLVASQGWAQLVPNTMTVYGSVAPTGACWAYYFYEDTVHKDTYTCMVGAWVKVNGSSSGGTVTTFSAGTLSPLFTTSVGTASTTPALSFTLSNAAAFTLFGNNTNAPAGPAHISMDTLFGSCSGANGALTYNTTTHAFGCNTITPGTGNLTATTPTANGVMYGQGTQALGVTAAGAADTLFMGNDAGVGSAPAFKAGPSGGTNGCAGTTDTPTYNTTTHAWGCHQITPGTGNVTAGGTLTSNAVVIGGGTTAVSTITASTTTTQALFATATAPAFRAISVTDVSGAMQGPWPLGNCVPDATGNIFYTVAALTNWRQGHWEWAKGIVANTVLTCTVTFPHVLPAGTAKIILGNLSANDGTAAHTMTFETCDIIPTTTMNVGALTCQSTQNFTTTTTAYAPATLTFGITSTPVADAQMIVQIIATTTSSMANNVQTGYVALEFQ
jgi:hypothetical protein